MIHVYEDTCSSTKPEVNNDMSTKEKSIKARRLELGLSVDQLASQAQVTGPMAIRLEQGADLPSVLTRILAALDALEQQKLVPEMAGSAMTAQQILEANQEAARAARQKPLDEAAERGARQKAWLAEREAEEAAARTAWNEKFQRQAQERRELGAEMKALRHRTGLTQDEFVEYAGSTISLVQRIELGQPLGQFQTEPLVAQYRLAAKVFATETLNALATGGKVSKVSKGVIR